MAFQRPRQTQRQVHRVSIAYPGTPVAMSITARGMARGALRAAVMVTITASLGGCSESTFPEVVRTFDRPTAISFSCFGDMRVTNGGPGSADQAIVRSAMPMASCEAWRTGTPPEGQGTLDEAGPAPSSPSLVAFVLQAAQGSVALIKQSPDDPVPVLRDADLLTPGLNTIPMGTLPVGLATDPTGCHVITANAGTCDLSILDVLSAYELSERPVVRRVAITNAAGDRIGAKPRAVLGDPRSAPVGFECAEEPDSLLYIAYPDCNMVAVVHAGTGQAVAGLVFRDDGGIDVTDGNVGCAAQCGAIVTPPGSGEVDAGVDPDAGVPGDASAAARPSELYIDGDSRRLYVGSENRSSLAIVELDENYLPVAASSIALEGDVGITSLAATGPIDYDEGTPFRFVYAAATDGTVRVIEAERVLAECDTQVDTRYLHDVSDVAFLSCMPVGDPRTPPRRVGARSPGIHLPGDMLPLGVAIAVLDKVPDDDPAGTKPTPAPLILKGVFAFISTTSGHVVMANVNDQYYAEFTSEPQSTPFIANIALALPHRIRDFGSSRGKSWDECSFPDPLSIAANVYRPRLEAEPGYTGVADKISQEKAHLLPSLRRMLCEDDNGQVSVPELSLMVDDSLRLSTFPDFSSVPVDEQWALMWEGTVSLDGSDVAVDGPPVRRGFFDVQAESTFDDASGPFCKMGIEPYDIMVIAGCDPTRGDAQCGLGETCYVHPSAPASVGSGICLPADRAEALSGPCRDFLTTQRRFTIREVYKEKVVLGERRRVLRTTPVTGCTSADQCQGFYELERYLASPEHPGGLEPGDSTYAWACEPDPGRAPGVPRCVMTCSASTDCEEGHACSGGYCVEGVLPPDECVASSAQRYFVQVGEAFSLIGSRTGFLHRRMADPVTGACVEDPDAHPLSTGRVPLVAPPCVSNEVTEVTPNPCSVTVQHAGVARNWDVVAGVCQDATPSIEVRDTQAIRFRNPIFTFHLVDPQTAGDAMCNGDLAGTGEPFSTVFPGYQITFSIVGGQDPAVLSLDPQDGNRRLAYPVAIAPGPFGKMWILDQGDRSSSIRGQVVWFDPESPVDILISNYLQ